MVAVLPVLLGQQYDAQALRNWPQSYIASAVGSLTLSSARTLRAQSLDTCRQVALLRSVDALLVHGLLLCDPALLTHFQNGKTAVLFVLVNPLIFGADLLTIESDRSHVSL